MFENERWVVRAQQLLQQAEKAPLVSQSHFQRGNSSRWRLLSCCCLIRAQRVLIGTHRNAWITGVPAKVPRITAVDLEEDVRFPWFLEIATKRKLAQVFVATVDLHRSVDPLCQVVLRHEPRPGSAQQGTGSFTPFRGFVMGALEEVESSLVEWRAGYHELLLVNWEAARKLGAASPPCSVVATAFLNLGYE